MRQLIPTKKFVILKMETDPLSKIIRPGTFGDDPNRIDIRSLRVIAVGPECKEVKVGDGIVADSQAIICFFGEGKERYFLTNEDNIGCVVRDKL